MTDSTQKDRDETYNVFLFVFTIAILVAFLSWFIAGMGDNEKPDAWQPWPKFHGVNND